MFSKVLIANRGLIQANCVRAVQELGAKAITIYESEDRNSAGVRNADEAYEIISSSSSRSYADIDQIVEIARAQKVDAVMSGYGFLAQNAEFSRKLKKHRIVTIAPELEGDHSLADKPKIKKLAKELGFQTISGSASCSDLSSVRKAAQKIGYPLLLKAKTGYGGKGLRVVERASEIRSAYEHVLSQCEKYAMNSHEVFVEKYLPDAHQIEFPVLRDKEGNVAVFPEQWCSIQRRFQKQLVESPSKIITADKRNKMTAAVTSLVSELDIVGYVSVVFLIDDKLTYFLEVNGYIQPFYTVTSMLTGVDLLKEQIKLFSGGKLKYKTENIKKHGHVISVSICAEDPDNRFTPSPGTIERLYLPFGQGINAQTNVFSGDTVGTFYDPMIAKLMARDTTRKETISKLLVALENFYIDGIKTNIPLMRAVIKSKEFQKKEANITFISKAENRKRIQEDVKTNEDEAIAAIIAAVDLHYDSNSQQILEAARENSKDSLWNSAARWFVRKNL